MPATRASATDRCARRGATLAEVVLAATALTVGVLGAAGLLTTAARDTTRARTRAAAVALLATRVERWRAASCAPGSGPASGTQTVGPLVERWRSARAGALATLADTVTLDAAGTRRTGLVAAAWCAP